jgi:hypothetical protein
LRDADIGEVSAILTTASHKRVILSRRGGIGNLTMPKAIECCLAIIGPVLRW